MAPVLQCPECGAKHPLDAVGISSSFPCTGCGRTLKVPSQARAMVPPVPKDVAPATVTPSPAPALDDDLDLGLESSDATRVVSTAPPPPVPGAASVTPPAFAAAAVEPPGVEAPVPSVPPAAERPLRVGGTPLGPVPGRWARFAMWIVAVPLAFLIVFTIARTFGLLTTNDVTDVALAEGWHRFVPIGRLVPFVALVTAALVHGGAYGMARYRATRTGGDGTASRPSRPLRPGAPRPSARPTPGKSPRQSSGAGR